MEFQKNVLVYMSGPITGKNGFIMEENIARALPDYIYLIQNGVAAFLPHFNGFSYTVATQIPYEVFLAYDFAMIDMCTHVYMMRRWEDSRGALLEREYAIKQGKPIAHSIGELFKMLGR